jgi:phage baseplate assembly protein gpV
LITYESIVIKLGTTEIDKNNLRKLTITRKINDHVRLYISGVVPDAQEDQYAEISDAETIIEVSAETAGESIPLFKGIIANIEIKAVRDIYYFEIEALSYTHLLDVELKSRSFQDKEISYSDLINEIIGENSICNYQGSQSEKLGTLLIQYRETNWVLLKRMASTFNTGLVAFAGSEAQACGDKPQFWFGIPEGKERSIADKLHYTVHKKIGVYRQLAANSGADVSEIDLINYEMLTTDFFDIGDTVTFKKQTLYVWESKAEIEGGILILKCILTLKNGLQQERLTNTQLIGAVLEGTVKDVSKDQVQVHLLLAESQDQEKAYWFPYLTHYAAEGNTGSYWMPEKGDYVKVQFPSADEAEGVAYASIRRANSEDDKTSDPQVKYFRTANGKEIMFGEKEIVISATDDKVLVRINEENGVEIYSEQPVSIQGKEITIKGSEAITIESEKTLTISGGSKVDIKCKGSEIQMDGSTQIAGSQVKIN